MRKWLSGWWRMRTSKDYVDRGLAGAGCGYILLAFALCVLAVYGMYRLVVG